MITCPRVLCKYRSSRNNDGRGYDHGRKKAKAYSDKEAGRRKLNTKEPIPAKGMPECPQWLLAEAKKEWERLADLMNQMGVLTEVDMAAFAAYCQSYARWKEAQEHITSEGSTFETDKGYQQQTPWVGIANTNQKLMLQAASEFGLTPSSRSRIVAGNAKGKEPEDEMEALLGGDA